MKILHVNLNYKVSSLYHHFSEHLINNGCDISVYFPTIKGSKINSLSSYLLEDPILSRYDRLTFNKRNKKVVKQIENLYDVCNFDILHAHSLFSNGYVAYSIKQKYRIPYIVAVRNTDLNLFFKKLVYMRRKGIKILEEAEKVICLSLPYKKQLLEKYVPKSLRKEIERKIEIIPNGIDQFWHENLNVHKEIKDKNKIKIISVGTINKLKNQLVTAKACQQLINKSGLNVELVIVGEIRDEKYFNELKKYKFVKHFSYQPKEKLLELYRSSDIYVMPSITETFGLVYGEAMSQGLPVIYTRGQGFDRQFKDGLVGYSVDSNHVSDITNKILLTIKNYNYISHNCIKLVNKFSWDEISKNYMKLYNDFY